MAILQDLCSSDPYLLIIILKDKNSDGSNLDMLKKSHNVLTLREKMNILDFIRKEKIVCGGS